MGDGILSAVGKTPLVDLNRMYAGQPMRFCAKLEMVNPGGSVKDRSALMMLTKALEEGKIDLEATIIESSSGNMAIGLAQVCRYLGLNFVAVVDPKINKHTLQILKTYGACIENVTEADASGNYLATRLQQVQQLLDEVPGSYWPNQYANEYNPAAHRRTMDEIVKALPAPPDYLFAATSTCGTLMGCADYISEQRLDTKIVAVDAVGSVIFGSPPGDRLVPGHGAGRPSDLLKKSAVDHVLHITDEECITGCRRLLQREAILAGGSSGAVVMATQKLQADIPDGSTCILILPDSGERYLDTVYNDEWLQEHFGKIEDLNQAVAKEEGSELAISVSGFASKSGNGQHMESRKIAIIGGGPKGMYGFERLAAQFSANPPGHNIEIHVYNKSSHFGAGNIYRPGQPGYLLMNNPVGDIDLWIDEPPWPVVSEPRSLTEWLRQNEDRDVTENDFVSRAAAGRYLMDGFEQIAANLPPRVCGEYVAGEVTDLHKKGCKYALKLKTAMGGTQEMPHRYDHILLATGHPRHRLREQEKQYRQFVEQKEDTGFVPFIYPVEEMLTHISAGSKVAMKGIGLTFVDAALTLTEGRGGRFKQTGENGVLVYQPGGNEPKAIYPFSRSGLPMIPRGPAPQQEGDPLKFFTRAALEKFKGENKIEFNKQILQLLKQEMIFAFYSIKMQQAGFVNDLAGCTTFDEVMHHIREFHRKNPDIKQFDPNDFLEPLKAKHFGDSKAFHAFIRSYLEFFLAEARRSELASAWAAVTGVWRKATPLFGEYYAFGGLTPKSQQYFDTVFRRLLNRVTFGPPVESGEKLLALMKAGILNFEPAQNPAVIMDEQAGAYVLNSEIYDRRQPVDYLVDARIPKVSLPVNCSPLYRNLLHRGSITMYRNESGIESYQPGCMALSPKGFVIDPQGNTNTAIAVTGTPTEGVTFDNDALSRTRNNFVSGWATFIRKLHSQSTAAEHADR